MRTPPVMRCSAVTPATPMELIRSTRAGGNVSSMPYSTPIFFICVLTLSQEKLSRHLMPPWPIVTEPFPYVKLVGNILHTQPMRQLHILIEKRIVVAHRQHKIVAP